MSITCRSAAVEGGYITVDTVFAYFRARRRTTVELDVQDETLPLRFRIRDHDATVPASFDTVLGSAGITIIQTPYHALEANAFAVRWIRSEREECLDAW